MACVLKTLPHVNAIKLSARDFRNFLKDQHHQNQSYNNNGFNLPKDLETQ